MGQDTEDKSRTKAKHEVEELQRIGERLLELSPEQIRKMAIPDNLKKEVLFGKTITRHGARRRQLQFIGAIMRTIDSESVVKAIDMLSMARAVAGSKFKKMEQLRDDFLEKDSFHVDRFIEENPMADRQKLGQLVRNAKKEIAAKKPPKSSRTLFKYIREILESRES